MLYQSPTPPPVVVEEIKVDLDESTDDVKYITKDPKALETPTDELINDPEYIHFMKLCRELNLAL